MSKSSSTARAKRTIKRTTAKSAKGAAKTASTPRAESKQSQLIAMLRQPDGATIAEIMAATKWAGHTARGFLSGALKKKLGLTITSEKVDGRGRVYKLPAA